MSANWFGTGINNQDAYTLTSRFDHRFTDKDQVFARHTFSNSLQQITNSGGLQGGSAPMTTDGAANGYKPESDQHVLVLSWTHTFSPTFFSETLFNWSRELLRSGAYRRAGQLRRQAGAPEPLR